MSETKQETPTRGPSKADSMMTKIVIGAVVVLALVALIVGGTSSGGSSDYQLLSASKPVSLSIPKIDANSSLIDLGLQEDDTLEVPSIQTPEQAGWYDQSPTPGSVGPAVILGHVNGSGKPGIFYRLKEVVAGDEIDVAREDGQTAVFTVSNVDTVPKAAFPSADVYADTPDSQLRLITCGGIFDESADSYEANVIVYANLTDVRPTQG